MKTSFDFTLFYSLPPKEVDRVPFDIDGNHIFKMKCTEGHWHDKEIDEKYFKVNNGDRVGFSGLEKQDIVWDHINALTYLSQAISIWCLKQVSYKERERRWIFLQMMWVLHYQSSLWCAKVTEYDYKAKIFTVYCEGMHNCILKEDWHFNQKFLEGQVSKHNLSNTLKEMGIDLISCNISTDRPDKAS